MSSKTRVCPWWLNFALDNPFRRIFTPSAEAIQGYLSKGMTFLDIGCGGGRFSVEAAKVVGNEGKVIALDIQKKMLDIVEKKIAGTELEPIIQTHLAEQNRLGLNIKADFALAMFMVHEVPDTGIFFKHLKFVLKTGAKLLVVEPKGHVSKDRFESEVLSAQNAGFKLIEMPNLGLFCRAFLVSSD